MYLVIDLETTCLEKYKRKGNPFYNSILCIGLKYPDKCLALPVDSPPKGYLIDSSISFGHHNVKILIGHNIKYDLLYLWRNQELQEALSNGLKIWDTQLAEYILTGQRHKYAALRDIAVNKYGCKERVKNIEVNFQQGITTDQMDINLLLEDVKNDVLDTEAVALQQVKLAKQKGMYNLIKGQMDALLATTEIEYNGMFVNLEILKKQQLELETKLEQRKKDLLKIVERYWK